MYSQRDDSVISPGPSSGPKKLQKRHAPVSAPRQPVNITSRTKTCRLGPASLPGCLRVKLTILSF